MEMPVAALVLRPWTTRIKMAAALLVLLLLAMWFHHGTSKELNGKAGVCTEAAWMEAREVGRQEAERKAWEAKSVQVEFEQLLLWALCSLLALTVNALFLYEAEPSLSADPLMTVQLCLFTAGAMILLTIVKCRQKWHSPALFANLLLISTTVHFIGRGLDPLKKMRGPNQIDEQVEKVISVGLLIAGCLVLPALMHGVVMSAWRGGGDSQWLVILTTLIVTSGVWVAVTLLCTKHLHNANLRDKEVELVAKDADNASLRADLQDKEAKLAAKDAENAVLRADLQDHNDKIGKLCVELETTKVALKEEKEEKKMLAWESSVAGSKLTRAEANGTKEKKRADTAVKENIRLLAKLKRSQKLADKQEVLMQKYHDTLAETNFKLKEALANHPEEQAELAKLKEKLEDRKIVFELEQDRIKQQVQRTKDDRVGSSRVLGFL